MTDIAAHAQVVVWKAQVVAVVLLVQVRVPILLPAAEVLHVIHVPKLVCNIVLLHADLLVVVHVLELVQDIVLGIQMPDHIVLLVPPIAHQHVLDIVEALVKEDVMAPVMPLVRVIRVNTYLCF